MREKIMLYITVLLTAAFIVISKTFSPIWLLFLIFVLLWPDRRDKKTRPFFMINILFIFFFFVFHYFAFIVPFIVGLGLAYILAPIVDFLEKRKIPRVIAILVLLLPLVAIIPLVLVLLVTNLLDELKFLIDKIPDVVHQSQLFFGNVIARLNEVGIQIDPNIIANTITSYLGNIMNGIVTTFGQISRGVRDIVILIYNFILIPLSAYLFLADRDKMADWVRNLFPIEERDKINGFIDRLNVSLAQYFRGQIIYMIIVGLIVGFALWILGIRYYVLLGVIAALGNLVPNIGFVLSFIPAILVGIFSPAPMVNTIKIVAVYFVEQMLENFVLGPVIIGKASRLHPVVVMIVLVLGGAIFGVWGVILAVPITVFVREFLNHFLEMHL